MNMGHHDFDNKLHLPSHFPPSSKNSSFPASLSNPLAPSFLHIKVSLRSPLCVFINYIHLFTYLFIYLLTYLLYRKQLAKVKAAGTLSEWFRVKKARQGCVLSPYLFNILAEMMMSETLDPFQGGLQIGGE